MTDTSNLYAPGVTGCSDGGCILSPPQGIHTNGGCRCAVKLRMAAGDIGWDVEKTIYYLRRVVKTLEAKVEELERQLASTRSQAVPEALREIVGWMETSGPTFHEAEIIGMEISGPTQCSSAKRCTEAAKLAFLSAASCWEYLHPTDDKQAEQEKKQ